MSIIVARLNTLVATILKIEIINLTISKLSTFIIITFLPSSALRCVGANNLFIFPKIYYLHNF